MKAMQWACALIAAIGLAGPSFAQDKERDIFNYAGQKKAGKDVKRIVFIAADEGHGGKGNHEFKAGAIYMARVLNSTYPNVHAVVYKNKSWPKDVSDADCVIVLLNGGDKAATDKSIKAAIDKGAGFMAIHYGVEVNKGAAGDNYLKWMGGYFETFWSVNPHWKASFKEFPKHPVANGLRPFSIDDEWYYHMRFADQMKGVTPILTAVPPDSTHRSGNDAHGANSTVFARKGMPEHVAWAYERPDGGRGFGFTGGHHHWNWGCDNFRKTVLNGIAWTAKLDIPPDGISSKTPTVDELLAVLSQAEPKNFNRERIAKMIEEANK